MSAQLTELLAEELWSYGLELDGDDIEEALGAAGLVLVPLAEEGSPAVAEFAEELHDIALLHDMIHGAADDPDDTTFASLTEQEFLLIALGLLHVGLAHCCFDEAATRLTAKLFEVYDAQRPAVEESE